MGFCGFTMGCGCGGGFILDYYGSRAFESSTTLSYSRFPRWASFTRNSRPSRDEALEQSGVDYLATDDESNAIPSTDATVLRAIAVQDGGGDMVFAEVSFEPEGFSASRKRYYLRADINSASEIVWMKNAATALPTGHPLLGSMNGSVELGALVDAPTLPLFGPTTCYGQQSAGTLLMMDTATGDISASLTRSSLTVNQTLEYHRNARVFFVPPGAATTPYPYTPPYYSSDFASQAIAYDKRAPRACAIQMDLSLTGTTLVDHYSDGSFFGNFGDWSWYEVDYECTQRVVAGDAPTASGTFEMVAPTTIYEWPTVTGTINVVIRSAPLTDPTANEIQVAAYYAMQNEFPAYNVVAGYRVYVRRTSGAPGGGLSDVTPPVAWDIPANQRPWKTIDYLRFARDGSGNELASWKESDLGGSNTKIRAATAGSLVLDIAKTWTANSVGERFVIHGLEDGFVVGMPGVGLSTTFNSQNGTPAERAARYGVYRLSGGGSVLWEIHPEDLVGRSDETIQATHCSDHWVYLTVGPNGFVVADKVSDDPAFLAAPYPARWRSWRVFDDGILYVPLASNTLQVSSPTFALDVVKRDDLVPDAQGAAYPDLQQYLQL